MVSSAVLGIPTVEPGDDVQSVRGLSGDARRAALLDSAERIIARSGPDTSMTAIAAEAGITKPVVYRVFGSKNGLHQALVERHAAVLLARLRIALEAPVSWDERALLAIETYLEFVHDRPALLGFLERSAEADRVAYYSRVADIQSVIADGLARALDARRGIPSGRVPRTESVVWAQSAVGMVRQVGDWWLASGMEVPRDSVAREASQVLLGGLAAVMGDSDPRAPS